jgi:hypothetical protein
MAARTRPAYWCRLGLPTGEIVTVWAASAASARRALAGWQRAGLELIARGTGAPTGGR